MTQDTSAPTVPGGVSGSSAMVWSASFIFIGTLGHQPGLLARVSAGLG